jgi:hypothetical protein
MKLLSNCDESDLEMTQTQTWARFFHFAYFCEFYHLNNPLLEDILESSD